jgi:hypothetical protein
VVNALRGTAMNRGWMIALVKCAIDSQAPVTASELTS